MYRIAICDGSAAEGKELEGIVTELAEEIGLVCSVDVFRTGKTLTESLQLKNYQLILMETVIGTVGGIDLARRLRFHGCEGEILFVTKNPEYALAAYAVFPVGYVLKPATKKKVREAFLHAVEKDRQSKTVYLRTRDGGSTQLKIDDILYIEVLRTELTLHCRSGIYKCSGSLTGLIEKLPVERFYRCHRCSIVNLKYVEHLDKYSFTLVTGEEVTVAKNRYAEAKQVLEAYTR